MYLPLDKDIIREMWVKGDLKDQLGLSHRNARKNKNMSESSLEASPMFPIIHERSISESLNTHHSYQLAMADSPPYVAAMTRSTSYLDTPPMNDTIELPLQESGVQYAQPMTKPSDSSHLSPTAAVAPTPSPQPSYYSASDIRLPSPLPSPKYQLPSGEMTSSAPPSRRSSVGTSSRATSTRGPFNSSLLPLPQTQMMYGKRALAGYAGAYEMQTYDGSSRPNSEASHPSFATADDFWSGDDDDVVVRHPSFTYKPRTPPPQPVGPQPHVTSQVNDEDDRSTVVAGSRRGSVDTWEGGRAM